jgi:hypothetical protein
MEHIAALLLLIGCNDSATLCEELPAPTVGYETIEQCEEAITPALHFEAKHHPLLIAKCLSLDPLVEGDMEIVWEIDGKGELHAQVVPVEDDATQAEPVIAGVIPERKASRLR